MTHSLSKPTKDLTPAEIFVIELGLRTDEEQRRIAALNRLATIEDQSLAYADYMASPEWRARSDAAKQRAGFRCQVCYSTRRLQAHHRTYDRVGREDDMDLTVLCDECHELFHQNKRLKR